MTDNASMVKLFVAELELCKIGPGQTLAILSEGLVRADYAQAFLSAGQELGATCLHLNLPARSYSLEDQNGITPLAGNRTAIEALKQADLVVDLLGLLFSPEQNEITQTGTRMLLVWEPFNVLASLFPTEDQRCRVEAGEALLRNARELRVTSPHGTDIRYRLGQYPVMTEYGYTDTPGRWDHWPSGFLLTQGNDQNVEGTVVLRPGDILNGLRRYVQSEVRLTIKGGMVTAIKGEGLDATLLRNYLDSYRDPRAYAVSHIGWGMNERAKWHHMAATRELDNEIGVNALAFYGNVLFSLGPNTELGGSNDTACHMDIPLCGCNLYLDDEVIVEAGLLVPLQLRSPEHI